MKHKLAILFLVAFVGVVAMLTLAAAALGPFAGAAFLMPTAVGVGLLARRARPARSPAEGRTCTCCTSTVHDPVTVVPGTVR